MHGCPKESTHLLSQAQSCCYAKIVQNQSCCLDEQFHEGVTHKHVERAGTYWHCSNKTCHDDLLGPRGVDTMWIPDRADCSTAKVLYIHGGSWMYGSPTTTGYAQFASKLAAATGAVLFVIDYPLIPYGNYTSILAAAVSGLQWLAEHGPLESCGPQDRAPLFVAGDSSGGGTAMSLLLQLQARPELLPGRRLAGAFMFSPWTNLMCNTPEYYTNAFAIIQDPHVRFTNLGRYEQFVGDIMFQSVALKSASQFNGNALQYAGFNASLQTDPIASPYFAQPEQFSDKDFPSLFFTVGGSESIMGDTVRVANIAGEGYADVEVEIYSGMWHVFPMYSEGCGSGHRLWSGQSAINSTGAFVRRVVAGDKDRVKHPFPRIHHLYDPHLKKFEKVGELLPARTHKHNVTRYETIMRDVAKEPWWVVLSSLATSAGAIFAAGVFLGNLMSYGGYKAYMRAKRVAEFRKHFVEVPAGYVSLDCLHAGGSTTSPTRSFLTDFIRGVPQEKSWRVETVRAKVLTGSGDDERIEAARMENAMWRRHAMGFGSDERPLAPLQSAPSKQLGANETLWESRKPEEVITQARHNPGETWVVSTKEAKEGSIDAARLENMAWRLHHIDKSADKQ